MFVLATIKQEDLEAAQAPVIMWPMAVACTVHILLWSSQPLGALG